MTNKKLGRLGEYIYELPVFPASVSPKFVGEIPSQTEAGCGLILLDGVSSLEHFETPNAMHRPLIRFVVRTKTYPQGTEWCDAIKDALHRYEDDFILQCFLQGAIMYLGKSPEKLYEFQFTFSTTIKE